MATEQSNPQKDPDDWVTGDEPMTGAQASYVQTLAQEAGEHATASAVAKAKRDSGAPDGNRRSDSLPEEMTKADASKVIDELQEKTGRGA